MTSYNDTKPTRFFASTSLFEHIVRGAIGICLLWLAIDIAFSHPMVSVALGIVTLILFKGCPVCWTIGLFETLYLKYLRLRHLSSTKK